MGIDQVINYITNFVHTNRPGAIAAGVILLFLLVKKPKIFLALLLICAVGIGFMQVYDNVSSTGITEKEYNALKEVK